MKYLLNKGGEYEKNRRISNQETGGRICGSSVWKKSRGVNEVISLSETAGFMYLHAEEADSAEELAELVSKAYEVEKSVVYEDVVSVVRTLREKGLLL